MRNPFQITRSGAGVAAATNALSKTASLAQIIGIADTSVALDVDIYLVVSATQPSAITGGTFIGKIRGAVSTTPQLPLLGFSGGIQISSPNSWVVANFID